MVSSKFFAVFILGFTLAACSVENRRSKDYMPGRPSGSVGDQNFTPTMGSDFAADAGTNFRIDSVKIVSSTIVPKEAGGFSANGLPKKKLFNFAACLKDSGGSALLPSMNFRITDDAGGVKPARTDVNGCLSWSEEHSYSYLTAETYYKLKRVIRAQKPYRGAVFAVIGFDPWQDGASAAVDLRTNSLPSGVELKDVGVLSVQGSGLMAQQAASLLSVNVDSVAFEFRGLDYDNFAIDPMLNLTVAHKYQIRIKPTVLRKTFANVAKADAFTGGCMKAYFAIFRERKAVAEQYQLNDLISSSQFDVCDPTQVGLYLADVSLKFPNVVDLTSRTLALVSLVPSEDIPGLGELSFYGLLKPGRLASLTLSPAKISARELVQKAEARATARASQSPVNLFASQAGFRSLDLSPVTVHGWFGRERTVQPAELLRASLAGPLSSEQTKDMALVLCEKLYASGSASNSLLHSCQSNPQDFVAFGRRDFAEKILDRPVKRNKEPLVDSLSMSISYSSTKSDSTKRGGKIEASFGFDVPFAKFMGDITGIKMSAGSSVYASRGIDESWGTTTSLSQKSEVTVASEGHTFGFDAEVRPCFIATRKTPAWATSQAAASAKTANEGVYACATETRKEARAETFYLLSQSVGGKDSLFTDSDSSDEVSWRMFIRGTGTKTLLFDAVKNSKATLVLEEIPDAELRTEVLGTLSTVQEFPGVLSATP